MPGTPPRPSCVLTHLITPTYTAHSSHIALVAKNPPANSRGVRDAGLISGSGRSEGNGNPVFLPGKFHEQRGPVVYYPWGCRFRHDKDTTKQTYII